VKKVKSRRKKMKELWRGFDDEEWDDWFD